MASRAAIKAGAAYILIEAMDKTATVFRGVANRLNGLSRNFLMASQQAGLLGAALAIPLASTIRTVTSFSDEILFLQSKLGITKDEMVDLVSWIKKLGRTTSFTATEIAQGATALAQAGFNKDDVMGLLPAISSMARGARMELGQTAELLSNVLLSFHRGQEVNNAGKVMDEFFIAAKNGTIEVEHLGASMVYVGQQAKMLGLTTGETLAMLSAMSLNFQRGSVAGTSFNQLLIGITDTTGKLNDELGFKAFTDEGGIKGFLQMFTELQEKLKGMSLQERINFLQTTFTVRGARALTTMIDDIKKNLDEMGGATGELSKKMETLLDSSIGGSVRRVLSAFEALKLATEETFVTTFQKIENVILPVVRGLALFTEKNQDVVVGIIRTIGAITAFTAATLTLGIGTRVLAIAFSGLATLATIFSLPFSAAAALMSGLIALFGLLAGLSPMGAIVTIPLLVAGLAALIALGPKIVDAFRSGMMELWELTKRIFASITTVIDAFVSDAEVVFNMFWQPIVNRLNNGDLESAFKVAMQGVKSVFELALLDMRIMWTHFEFHIKDSFRQWIGDLQKSLPNPLGRVDELFGGETSEQRTHRLRFLTKEEKIHALTKLEKERGELLNKILNDVAKIPFQPETTDPELRKTPWETVKEAFAGMAKPPSGFSTVIPTALDRTTVAAQQQALQNQLNLLGSIDSTLKAINAKTGADPEHKVAGGLGTGAPITPFLWAVGR